MADDSLGMEIAVRKAFRTDASRVCGLLFGLKTMYGSCVERSLADFERQYLPTVEVVLESSCNAVWLAEAKGACVAGFLSTTRRPVMRLAGVVGVLEEVFVKREYRGKGVAIQLWEAAIQELRKHGVSTVEVVTSLAHPGQRRFARKIGLEWYANIHRVEI